jgi:hypothetical protein
MMRVRIKKTELIADDKLVLVTLDAGGREFQFAIDLWEVYDPSKDDIDIDRINEVLIHWKRNVIPRSIAVEAKSKDDKMSLIKKMEGIEV